MVGLDTNVLVRFLVQDDEAQQLEAAQLLTGLNQRGETGFVPDIVLAELSWVLERCYGFTRDEIGASVRKLLLARQLTFRCRDEVRNAVDQYERGGAGLADQLLTEQAKSAGCRAVATFDENLQKRTDCMPPRLIPFPSR